MLTTEAPESQKTWWGQVNKVGKNNMLSRDFKKEKMNKRIAESNSI